LATPDEPDQDTTVDDASCTGAVGDLIVGADGAFAVSIKDGEVDPP